MAQPIEWNDRYRDGELPWDTNAPSSQLQQVLGRHSVPPCRALEIGCGTGTNSVWLSQQGFEVTAIDLAPLAIERAKQRAQAAQAPVRFAVADVLMLPDLSGPFAFFFDRGCYHAVRRSDPRQYAPAVARQLVTGARGLILAGRPRGTDDPGPPVVTEEELREELGLAFRIVELEQFRFDEAPGIGERFPAWSCLVEKR